MTRTIARAAMALAMGCLGEERRAWAAAMRAEFEAVEPRRALGFAIGCLVGAWRVLPDRADGRLLLARWAVAIGLVLPVAALPIAAVLAGSDGMAGAVNAGNRAALPVLAALALLLGAEQVRVAWALLDRDWAAVADAAWLTAAMAVTLVGLTGILFLSAGPALSPMAAMAGEAAAVSWLARRHRPEHRPEHRDASRTTAPP